MFSKLEILVVVCALLVKRCLAKPVRTEDQRISGLPVEEQFSKRALDSSTSDPSLGRISLTSVVPKVIAILGKEADGISKGPLTEPRILPTKEVYHHISKRTEQGSSIEKRSVPLAAMEGKFGKSIREKRLVEPVVIFEYDDSGIFKRSVEDDIIGKREIQLPAMERVSKRSIEGNRSPFPEELSEHKDYVVPRGRVGEELRESIKTKRSLRLETYSGGIIVEPWMGRL